MIPQPNWKEIFRTFATLDKIEELTDYNLCLAGLSFIDFVADTKRMKDIAYVGMAESKTFVVWVHIVLSDMKIDRNHWLEVKRLVNTSIHKG